MKKIIKRLFVLTLVATLGYAPSVAFASDNGFLWDESTGKTTYYDILDEETTYYDDLDEEATYYDENTQSSRALPIVTFSRYEQASTTINYKAKYVGQARVDNSANKLTPANLQFTATSSGTWDVSGSIQFQAKGEAGAIIAKVETSVTIGASVSRSWTTGYSYGSSVSVPAGKIGTISAYIPGTVTSGNLVYKHLNVDTGESWITTHPVNQTIPSKDSWNFVVAIN